MNGELTRWYRSKVDWWLAPVLAIPPIASIVVLFAAFTSGGLDKILGGIGGVLFVAALYGGLVFPIRYGIGGGRLVIRFGICRQKVELSDIREVYPTRNPLSSPALSLDRLHIQFGDSFFKAVMISPADRDEFLADLAASAGLERDGNRLRRAAG